MTFRTVKLGLEGTDVAVCQALLRSMQILPYDNKPLSVTGVCDELTVSAINIFQSIQRAYGHECGTAGKNDGCFGRECWARSLGIRL